MITSSETKIGRLKYRVMMRKDMIDANEREIERRKSYNRNLKEQVRRLSREIAAEYQKACQMPMAAYELC